MCTYVGNRFSYYSEKMAFGAIRGTFTESGDSGFWALAPVGWLFLPVPDAQSSVRKRCLMPWLGVQLVNSLSYCCFLCRAEIRPTESGFFG